MESETDIREKIIEAYRNYILEHGTEPASIYSFTKDIGIEEDQFYEYFNQFSQVAEAFWSEVLNKSLGAIREDENYRESSVREKFLSFYFQFFSDLRKHRSYFLLSFDEKILGITSSTRNLGEFKKLFKEWASELIKQGISNQEISPRSRISDTYDSLFWYQFLFLLNFWQNDRTPGFEKTDAAIEKSVNLAFDLVEKNALDSAMDFGKFMFQNR